MIFLSENLSLTNLEKGVWTPVIDDFEGNEGKCMSTFNYLVKPEEGKVTLAFIDQNDPEIGGYVLVGKSVVIHEDIFHLVEDLSMFSLDNITLVDLLLNVAHTVDSILTTMTMHKVFNSTDTYPHVSEYSNYIQEVELSEEIKSANIQLNGGVLHIQ